MVICLQQSKQTKASLIFKVSYKFFWVSKPVCKNWMGKCTLRWSLVAGYQFRMLSVATCRKGDGGVGAGVGRTGRGAAVKTWDFRGSGAGRALRLVCPRRGHRQLWAPLVGGDLRKALFPVDAFPRSQHPPCSRCFAEGMWGALLALLWKRFCAKLFLKIGFFPFSSGCAPGYF